jgi:large subunit ribosomal protein L29
MANAQELRDLSDQQLVHQILESERGLVQSQLSNKMGQLENTASLRDIRRGIARMRTVIGERERSQELKKDSLIHEHRQSYKHEATGDAGGDQGGFLSGIVDKLSTSE